jgi:hypothetical protein
MVGLVLLGMYCDINPLDFVQEAQELLTEDDSIVDKSTSNIGLSAVHKRMRMAKKLEIKKVWSWIHISSTFPLLLATSLVSQNVEYKRALNAKRYFCTRMPKGYGKMAPGYAP